MVIIAKGLRGVYNEKDIKKISNWSLYLYYYLPKGLDDIKHWVRRKSPYEIEVIINIVKEIVVVLIRMFNKLLQEQQNPWQTERYHSPTIEQWKKNEVSYEVFIKMV